MAMSASHAQSKSSGEAKQSLTMLTDMAMTNATTASKFEKRVTDSAHRTGPPETVKRLWRFPQRIGLVTVFVRVLSGSFSAVSGPDSRRVHAHGRSPERRQGPRY